MSGSIAKGLRSADPAERRAACGRAAADPAAALHLDLLARTLGDPDPSVARAASDALVELGRRLPGVSAALREALRSEDPPRRVRAAFTIARLEPPTPALLPALVEGLAWRDGASRWTAARLLVEAGRLHGEVLPLLLGLVRVGEGASVRRMATFCLRELAPDRPEAARVLLEATRDAERSVRRGALSALAALSDPPSEVSSRLLEVLDADEDATSRCIAAAALGELAAAGRCGLARETTERLRGLRENAPDPALRRAADRALARSGSGPGR